MAQLRFLLHVLKVFVGPDGEGGNPLGVFLNGGHVAEEVRQRVAADLGFSETVFVDDMRQGRVRIFTPAAELPLAGHPLVGTSWLLAYTGRPVATLRPPAGEVPTWQDGPLTWIRARPEWAPPFELRQYRSPADVDALIPPAEPVHLDAWAWEDEPAGLIRSRVFVPALGVPEDEATGSAALRLARHVGRPIRIRQGTGSLIEARPENDGENDGGDGRRDGGAVSTVSVGGVTALVEVREYAIPR